MGRLAVDQRQPRPAAGVAAEAELGGDDHPVADGGQRFADQLFVDERAVDLGRVEERHAAFDGGMNQGDHLALVARQAIALAHAHAAQADGRDF